MVTMRIRDVPQALRATVPETGPLIDDHLNTYAEVLPHVMFGDVTRLVVQAHESGQTELEGRCLTFLERALIEGDDDVRDVIEASFLENIGPWETSVDAWVASWPPALLAAAQRESRPPST